MPLLLAGGWVGLVAVLLGLRRSCANAAACELSVVLVQHALARTMQLPASYFDSRGLSATLTPFHNLERLDERLRDTLIASANLLLVPVGVVLLAGQHFYLGGVAFLVAAFTVTVSSRAVVKMSSRQRDADRFGAMVHAELIETVEHVATVKALALDGVRCHKVCERLRKLKTAQARLLANHTACLQCLAAVLLACVLSSVWLLQDSAGEVFATSIAWVLVAAPLWQMLNNAPVCARLLRSLQQAAEINDLASSQEAGDRRMIPSTRGLVCLEDVSFAPHPESPEILSHVSLDLTPGRMHWLFGRAGAGKTTLAQLLTGRRQPTRGTVKLDGLDLRRVHPSCLRGLVSFVPQQPEILQGTFRANIALAEPKAALERVIAAARMADLHELIMSFPQGYNTNLGKPGVLLSSGEKQKLSLARAFFEDPGVLILDEPAGWLDVEAECVLLKSLRLLSADRTVLVATSRRPPVHADDEVIVLDEGRIAEKGKPGELSKQPGLFISLMGRLP